MTAAPSGEAGNGRGGMRRSPEGGPRLPRKDAGAALDAVCDTITDALASGDSVGIVGFGTFEVKQRQARTGRNPKTGAELQIPAKNVPSFRAGKKLKDGVN